VHGEPAAAAALRDRIIASPGAGSVTIAARGDVAPLDALKSTVTPSI
jgi:hypothetical protein